VPSAPAAPAAPAPPAGTGGSNGAARELHLAHGNAARSLLQSRIIGRVTPWTLQASAPMSLT
jgi:hypothetical protein